jgi:hypothetical protein
MLFTELRNGMTVMDARRCVAWAHPARGGWLLKLHGGCWLDPRARTGGIFPGKFPDLLHVKTRREARSIMTRLTQ